MATPPPGPGTGPPPEAPADVARSLDAVMDDVTPAGASGAQRRLIRSMLGTVSALAAEQLLRGALARRCLGLVAHAPADAYRVERCTRGRPIGATMASSSSTPMR